MDGLVKASGVACVDTTAVSSLLLAAGAQSAESAADLQRMPSPGGDLQGWLGICQHLDALLSVVAFRFGTLLLSRHCLQGHKLSLAVPRRR